MRGDPCRKLLSLSEYKYNFLFRETFRAEISGYLEGKITKSSVAVVQTLAFDSDDLEELTVYSRAKCEALLAESAEFASFVPPSPHNFHRQFYQLVHQRNQKKKYINFGRVARIFKFYKIAVPKKVEVNQDLSNMELRTTSPQREANEVSFSHFVHLMNEHSLYQPELQNISLDYSKLTESFAKFKPLTCRVKQSIEFQPEPASVLTKKQTMPKNTDSKKNLCKSNTVRKDLSKRVNFASSSKGDAKKEMRCSILHGDAGLKKPVRFQKAKTALCALKAASNLNPKGFRLQQTSSSFRPCVGLNDHGLVQFVKNASALRPVPSSIQRPKDRSRFSPCGKCQPVCSRFNWREVVRK